MKPFSRVRVLITAGPTQEPLDPIRFISNRSSGLTGFSLARALGELGARVTLISGPSNQKTPEGCHRINIRTAREMREQVLRQIKSAEIFISCAAVSDFRPARPLLSKIKKGLHPRGLRVRLIPNPDILKEVAGKWQQYRDAAKKGKRFLIGFSLETNSSEKEARRKMHGKNLDLLVANGASAMESARTQLSIYPKDRRALVWPKMSKWKAARRLALLISQMRDDQR